MVCAHCGSESHRTGSSNCPNYTYWWRRSCVQNVHELWPPYASRSQMSRPPMRSLRRIKGFCPDVQCPSALRSFWSREHCINVQVDWLTILLSVSASHTITELLKASDCTVDPNTLRSGGKFRKFADWEHVKQTCDSIGAEQLLELKHATSDFQKNRIASYKNL